MNLYNRQVINNIYLIGFAGSGKTTTGALLAHVLKYSFVDLDRYIELQIGCDVTVIFRKFGEQYFRKHEHNALQEISMKRSYVVATGGGVVLLDKNWECMRNTGTIVFLDVHFDELYARISDKERKKRPLFRNKQKEEIAVLYKERRSYYQKATLHVQTSQCTVAEVAQKIKKALKELGPPGLEPGTHGL